MSWQKDGSGFCYSSFGVPRTAAERAEALKRANFNHKVYFHKLGTPQTEDAVVYQRPDDKEEVIAKRLEVYATQTQPLIEHYRRLGLLHVVQGEGALEEVSARMEAAAHGKD